MANSDAVSWQTLSADPQQMNWLPQWLHHSAVSSNLMPNHHAKKLISLATSQVKNINSGLQGLHRFNVCMGGWEKHLRLL